TCALPIYESVALQCGPGVKDQRACCFGALDPLDRGADVDAARVVLGGEHDGYRRVLRSSEVGTQKASCCRGRHRPEQVALEQREQRLRLGIAEAAVELQHLWPIVRKHESGVEHADEWRAPYGELVEDWTMDRVEEPLDLGQPETSDRRVRPHAAGVGTCVALLGPLEILCGWQGKGASPVAEGEDRDLFSFEQLFDQDRIAE